MLIEELENYNSKKRLIEKLEQEKERITTRATKITPVYSDTTSRTNQISDKVGNNAILLAELDTKIEWYKSQLQTDLTTILDSIMQLDPQHSEILFSYYCEDKTISQIADETNYSIDSIKKKKREAIEKIKNITLY